VSAFKTYTNSRVRGQVPCLPWMRVATAPGPLAVVKHGNLHCHKAMLRRCLPACSTVRATPRGGTANRPLPWDRSGRCSQWARVHVKFLHLHHCILSRIASSTPKIPLANLFFQPHPPNTEKISSLILLQ
jgi:hypothetical protein